MLWNKSPQPRRSRAGGGEEEAQEGGAEQHSGAVFHSLFGSVCVCLGIPARVAGKGWGGWVGSHHGLAERQRPRRAGPRAGAVADFGDDAHRLAHGEGAEVVAARVERGAAHVAGVHADDLPLHGLLGGTRAAAGLVGDEHFQPAFPALCGVVYLDDLWRGGARLGGDVFQLVVQRLAGVCGGFGHFVPAFVELVTHAVMRGQLLAADVQLFLLAFVGLDQLSVAIQQGGGGGGGIDDAADGAGDGWLCGRHGGERGIRPLPHGQQHAQAFEDGALGAGAGAEELVHVLHEQGVFIELAFDDLRHACAQHPHALERVLDGKVGRIHTVLRQGAGLHQRLKAIYQRLQVCRCLPAYGERGRVLRPDGQGFLCAVFGDFPEFHGGL